MAKVGYLYKAEDNEAYTNSIEWMNEYGCIRVMIDKADDEKLRPQWKQLIERLARGDELVVYKFSNAVRSTTDLSNLIELCRTMKVRLISFGDEIDSTGRMFPKTTAQDVLRIFGELPDDLVALRSEKEHIKRLKKAALARKVNVVSKTNREQTIVNMYHQGYAVDDIWTASGFSSKSSVFRILNKHGVTLNRGKFSGPIGSRKKK